MSRKSIIRGRASVVPAPFAAVAVLALCGSALALPINGRVPVRTFTVGPAGTANPDATIAQDFQFANAIFNQIGIQFDNQGDTFVQANTPASTNQWNRYQFNSVLNTPARQQAQGFAYYILPGTSYLNGTTTLATTWSQEDVGNTINDPDSIATTTVRVRTIAARGTRGGTDTVPHEFGHMLNNQFRWRWFEAADGNVVNDHANTVHSRTATDLMYPSVQNPTAAQLYPQGTAAQLGHNIGNYAGGAVRVPQITTLYNNSNVGGSSAGNAMYSQINRAPFQYSMNQNSSTIVQSPLWGITDNITMPTTGGGNHVYTVDETARRAPGSTETFSFFITSTTGFSLGGDLLQGWNFSAFGINSLDGSYTSFVANSVQVRIWTDILASPATSDANGGVGQIVSPALYTSSGGVSGGGIFMNLNFFSADAGVLAGYRDMQITFSANWIPAPGAAGLLGLTGLLASRRRRR